MELEKLVFVNDLLFKVVPGISRTTLWRWIKTGKFPRPINVGPRRIGWKESTIKTWLDSLATKQRPNPQQQMPLAKQVAQSKKASNNHDEENGHV